jgi:replicative DNA helicase
MNAFANADAMQMHGTIAAEIERALLGACMTYPAATQLAMTVVEEGHFCFATHARIWQAAVAFDYRRAARQPDDAGRDAWR